MEQPSGRLNSTDHAASDFWCGVLLDDTSAVQPKAENADFTPLPSIPDAHVLQQQQQQQQPQQQQQHAAAWVPEKGFGAAGQKKSHWPEAQHRFFTYGNFFDSADPTLDSTTVHVDWQQGQQSENPLHTDIAWLDLGPGMPLDNSPSRSSSPTRMQAADDLYLPRGESKHLRRASGDRRRHPHDGPRPPGTARPARTETERVERRMAKNRATAAASRQRRKALQADLMTRTSELEGENNRLMDLVLSKDAEIAHLRDQISAVHPA